MKQRDIKRRKQMFAVLKHNILDDIKFQHATTDFQRTLGIVRKESVTRKNISIKYRLGSSKEGLVETTVTKIWQLTSNCIYMETDTETIVVPVDQTEWVHVNDYIVPSNHIKRPITNIYDLIKEDPLV